MSKRSYNAVRTLVAEAAATETGIERLTALASDAAYEIRCAVAENPNTPAETLTALAADES